MGRFRRTLLAFVLSVATIMGVGLLSTGQAHADTFTWSSWKKCWYVAESGNGVGWVWVRYGVQWNTNNSARRVFGVGYDAGSGKDYYVIYASAVEQTGGNNTGTGANYRYVPGKTGRWYIGTTTTGQLPWIDKTSTAKIHFDVERNGFPASWAHCSFTI